ncbi:response regulator transcription factor [Bacillus tianshenii]|nr:response regulator transcription factor [Bacillus tianshenii]
MKEKIMIVEDEAEIRELIELYLHNHGYETVTTDNGLEAVEMFYTESPDLVVLDILLPGADGITVCKKIRETSLIPILFLSCKREAEDIITGLELGADDYITKPFDPSILVARIKANLRRLPFRQQDSENLLKYGNLEIDLNAYLVKVNGEGINLFAKELQLLILLARNPDKVFSVDQLYSSIWGVDSFGDTRTVMVHISNLRKKIEVDPANPIFIQTVRGFGYKFSTKLPNYE